MSHDQAHDGEGGAGRRDSAWSSGGGDPAESTAECDSAQEHERRRDSSSGGADDPTSEQVRDEIAQAEETVEAEIVDPATGQKRALRRSIWKAPLPPASEMRAYNEIDPSFAERIMRGYERQIEVHERREESISAAVESEVRVQSELARADIRFLARGQWMLYSLAIVALVSGIIFAVLGMGASSAAAVIVAGLTMAPNIIGAVSRKLPLSGSDDGSATE